MTSDVHKRRETLPFYAGANVIVQKLAEQHHALSTDPLVQSFIPAAPDSSWAELLDAAMRALTIVGKEIAEGTTEAQVAAAQMRERIYSAGLEQIRQALLAVALKKLANGPLIVDQQVEGGLVAYGRASQQGLLEMIDPILWESGEVDWERRHLRAATVLWTGVRVLDCSNLDIEDAQLVERDYLQLPRFHNQSYEKASDSFSGDARDNADHAAPKAGVERPASAATQKPRGGRPTGTGYEILDTPIAEQMIELVQSGKANSLRRAAEQIVGRDAAGAAGAGEPTSKFDRLTKLANKLRKARGNGNNRE